MSADDGFDLAPAAPPGRGAGPAEPDLFSLDNLTGLNEEEAFRLRIDQRNLRRLPILLWSFALVSLIHAAVGLTEDAGLGFAGSWPGFLLGAANLLACAGLALSLPVVDPALARFLGTARFGVRSRIAHRATTFATAYLLAQFVLTVAWLRLVYGGEGGNAWSVLYPWAALLLRLRPPQALALHGGLVAAAIADGLVFENDVGLMIAAGVINGIVLGAGSLATHRFRKDFLEHWRSAADRGRVQARMQEELETARNVQLSMLPNEPPRLPWLDVATATLPATEVGGDYYDFFPRADGGLVVVIGDVAGHGLASGLVLSGVRSGLHVLMEGGDDLPESLERLNRMVQRTSHSRMRVSMAAVEILPGGREMRVASAGHPPVLVRNGRTGEVTELDLPALPLGSSLGGPAHAETRSLGPGDVLLLYTDGFFEATDAAGEPFGIERIREILAGHDPDAGSSALKERLLRELWTFREHAPQDDDVTLVALTIRDPGSGRPGDQSAEQASKTVSARSIGTTPTSFP